MPRIRVDTVVYPTVGGIDKTITVDVLDDYTENDVWDAVEAQVNFEDFDILEADVLDVEFEVMRYEEVT